MTERLESYIDELVSISPMLIEANEQRNFEWVSKIIKQHALTAHHVYGALNAPNCNKNCPRVLLDPLTVLNRSKSTSSSIDDLEFWQDPDMIKTLSDYLDLRFRKN